jgi:hypothetical protein
MNRTLLFSVLMMLLSIGIKAQINLIGVSNNIQTGNINVVKWEALNLCWSTRAAYDQPLQLFTLRFESLILYFTLCSSFNL